MNSSDDEYQFQIAADAFKRRHRRERIPKSSAELVSQLISRKQWAQTQWNDQLQQIWRQAIGQELAEKTRATRINRGRLEVLVEGSAAMQQLAFVKSTLLAKMQQQLPEANILSIRFRVGPLK